MIKEIFLKETIQISFLNVGENDGLVKGDIIGMLNRGLGKKVELGRIKVLNDFSFFEVERNSEKRYFKYGYKWY